MSEAVLTLLFVILAPVLAYVILRNAVAAFFVSAPLGMLAACRLFGPHGGQFPQW